MTTAAVILFVLAIIVLLWIIVEWGQRGIAYFNDYEAQYKYIQDKINDKDLEITEGNYNILMDRIIALSKMKHKNKEKTTVLAQEFAVRFASKKLR